MSERPQGVPAGTIPPARESAVVVVARAGHAGEWEVLMGLRSRRSGFFPGNWAFPGGGLEPQDEPARPGAHARCGARELREETGVAIPPDRLVPIGVRTTPPFHPVRYRTEFFVAEAPPDLDLTARPSSLDENEDLRFLVAGAALAAWEQGEIFFPPPLPPLLRVFAAGRGLAFDEVARRLLAAGEIEERVPRIEFVPSIWMLPLLSATLPPATHTNAWIAGVGRLVIVDPGTDEAAELERLQQVLERRMASGARLHAVLLTHHHRDHVAGAPALARRYGAPLRAHPATAALLRARGIHVTGDIEGGAVLDLDGLTLIAHHTPGHAPGHLVFEVPERRAALVGDLLSGFSSIFIPPGPEGDMGAYVDALRRVRALDLRLLHPAHGPPLVPAAIDAAIAHRLDRERRVLDALRDTPRPLVEIAADAYADTPSAPAELARLQTLAQLEALARAGRATAGPAATWTR